jgi:hypothetical protein
VSKTLYLVVVDVAVGEVPNVELEHAALVLVRYVLHHHHTSDPTSVAACDSAYGQSILQAASDLGKLGCMVAIHHRDANTCTNTQHTNQRLLFFIFHRFTKQNR